MTEGGSGWRACQGRGKGGATKGGARSEEGLAPARSYDPSFLLSLIEASCMLDHSDKPSAASFRFSTPASVCAYFWTRIGGQASSQQVRPRGEFYVTKRGKKKVERGR